ncbi:MAG TPA: hypothetical protein VJV40_04120 [Thermodesulfobacteriota bacterium]|nr:hypothetical protein [Thermodesulfobacteriota bacterium]
MMRKLALIILPVLILAGCSQKSVYVPKSYRTKSATDEEKEKEKKGAAIVTAGETENKTNFKAPFDKVFTAAVESVQYLQWNIAFVEQQDGTIRLQEAYVYEKNGKLYRSYIWPSSSYTSSSNVNYYLEKVGKYSPGTSDTHFTQENLKVTVKKVSDDLTEVKIDYYIHPYTYQGTIGYEVMSNGYIESIIIDHMKDILAGKPVAMER